MTDLQESKSIFYPGQEKFLTHKHRDKLLTEFKVGKNQLIIYGSPLIMAQLSGLIDSMLDNIANTSAVQTCRPLNEVGSKEPCPLMGMFEVEGRALQIIFLYLHSFDWTKLPLDKLNLVELLSMFDIIKYLNIEMNGDNTLESEEFYGQWSYHLKCQFKEKNKAQLIENKDRIAQVLNSMIAMHEDRVMCCYYGDIFHHLNEMKTQEIIQLVNYVIIIKQDLVGSIHHLAIVDKKQVEENSEEIFKREGIDLVKVENKTQHTGSTNLIYTHGGLRGVPGGRYELQKNVVGALIFKKLPENPPGKSIVIDFSITRPWG